MLYHAGDMSQRDGPIAHGYRHQPTAALTDMIRMPLRMFVVGRQVKKLRGGRQCAERGGFRLRRQAGGLVLVDGGVVALIDGSVTAEL